MHDLQCPKTHKTSLFTWIKCLSCDKTHSTCSSTFIHGLSHNYYTLNKNCQNTLHSTQLFCSGDCLLCTKNIIKHVYEIGFPFLAQVLYTHIYISIIKLGVKGWGVHSANKPSLSLPIIYIGVNILSAHSTHRSWHMLVKKIAHVFEFRFPTLCTVEMSKISYGAW